MDRKCNTGSLIVAVVILIYTNYTKDGGFDTVCMIRVDIPQLMLHFLAFRLAMGWYESLPV